VGQPTFNPARTRLTRGLSEPGWVQPTFEKVEFFSTQPGSNPWWAGLAHGLKPILTSLITATNDTPSVLVVFVCMGYYGIRFFDLGWLMVLNKFRVKDWAGIMEVPFQEALSSLYHLSNIYTTHWWQLKVKEVRPFKLLLIPIS